MNTQVKKSFACKNIGSYTLNTNLLETHTPKAGDVGIFRVVNACGNFLLGPDQNARTLFNGDLVMLAFGARYATSQYEGYVPGGPVVNPCHLLGRGGVAGYLASRNPTFKGSPATIELIGYACSASGKVLNTIRYNALSNFNLFDKSCKVILSVGSSMDSGKTTTAAYLCGGLAKAGKRVAFVKLTGTAFPKDLALSLDRGAHFAADFTQFGFPSTYLLDKETLLKLYQSLIQHVQLKSAAEYVVLEIADGVLQRETQMLLNDASFMSTVHAVMYSAGDSMGAIYGEQLLKSWGISPFAVTGLFTSSELLIREAKDRIETPVLGLDDLYNGQAVALLKAIEPEYNWHEGEGSDEQQLRYA